MQSNKSRLLLASLLVMSAGKYSVIAQAAVDGNSLKTMAETLPMEVDIRGRFLFSPVFFPEIGSNVFVCEIDHAQSGGRFCFATTNGSVRVLGDATGGIVDVFQVLKDEWYLVSKSGGASALASIPFRRWHDGTDEAGLNVVSDISIYRFGGGMVSIAASPSLPGLVCSPDFSSLERPDWYFARRSGTNEWASTILSNKVDNKSRIDDDPLLGGPIIQGGSQKTSIGMSPRITTAADYESGLNSALSDQFSTAFPTTARVVLEAAGTAHTPFVLISTGENEDTDRAFIPWSRVREHVFTLIRGKRTPLAFKFVFMLPKKAVPRFLEKSGIAMDASEVTGLFLNVSFRSRKLMLTTGTSLRTFTMDRSVDNAWDSYILGFLKSREIAAEKA